MTFRKHKKGLQAFTLAEMIITVGIMGILTGLSVKIWSGLDRSAKSVDGILSFSANSQNLMQRFVSDIQNSVTAATTESDLLQLAQLRSDGKRLVVRYHFVENELIRSEYVDGEETAAIKIAALDPERIRITATDTDWIRLEISKPGRNRPLERKNRKLITYARTYHE